MREDNSLSNPVPTPVPAMLGIFQNSFSATNPVKKSMLLTILKSNKKLFGNQHYILHFFTCITFFEFQKLFFCNLYLEKGEEYGCYVGGEGSSDENEQRVNIFFTIFEIYVIIKFAQLSEIAAQVTSVYASSNWRVGVKNLAIQMRRLAN